MFVGISCVSIPAIVESGVVVRSGVVTLDDDEETLRLKR